MFQVITQTLEVYITSVEHHARVYKLTAVERTLGRVSRHTHVRFLLVEGTCVTHREFKCRYHT